MSLVGIIANPSAGKDIRRLVAQARMVPNQEKINTIRRVLHALDSLGVQRVVIMPDMARMGLKASENTSLDILIDLLDMPIRNNEEDSTIAAQQMASMGVSCLITLGGDGTNRAVSKGAGDIPIIPISTGTNNVFPEMIEGTTAGLAAGVIAKKWIDWQSVSTKCKQIELYLDGKFTDLALVDLAISTEHFVGARAIWDLNRVKEIFLTSADPANIGLSSIGGQLHPLTRTDDGGLHLTIGRGGLTVLAPIAPGVIEQVPITNWRMLPFGERSEIKFKPCTIALDGERQLTVKPHQTIEVAIFRNGPQVVSIKDALLTAAKKGFFVVEPPSL